MCLQFIEINAHKKTLNPRCHESYLEGCYAHVHYMFSQHNYSYSYHMCYLQSSIDLVLKVCQCSTILLFCLGFVTSVPIVILFTMIDILEMEYEFVSFFYNNNKQAFYLCNKTLLHGRIFDALALCDACKLKLKFFVFGEEYIAIIFCTCDNYLVLILKLELQDT